MTEKGTMIICALGSPDDRSPEGSTVDVCQSCGREIRIAPTGREWAAHAPPPVELVCAPCAVELLGPESDFSQIPQTRDV